MTPQNLKKARKRLGLNQTAFGRLIGLTLSTITKMERGHIVISERTELMVRAVMDRHLAEQREEIDALFEESE